MDFDGIDTFSYLICVEVSSIDYIPEKMVARTIPAQKYAVFTAKGEMTESIQQAWKDIYGKWFPASGYERSFGPDFEWTKWVIPSYKYAVVKCTQNTYGNIFNEMINLL